jgi:hypothetical protein
MKAAISADWGNRGSYRRITDVFVVVSSILEGGWKSRCAQSKFVGIVLRLPAR